MSNITVSDFTNVLCLRSQLVNLDEKDIVEYHKDYERYLTFIDTVAVMSEIDSAFLLFRDDFIDKIYSVIQIYRFDIKDNQIKEAINSIINYLNVVKSYEPEYKQLLKKSYHSWQEEVRNVWLKDESDLVYSLGYDAVVYAGIVDGDMDIITENDMFLYSINYFVETIPSIFENKDVQNRTMKLINKLGKGFSPFKKELRMYSLETKENLQKIKLKEE